MLNRAPSSLKSRALACCALLTLTLVTGGAAAGSAPELSVEGDSQAGHVTLSWRSTSNAGGEITYEVQQAASETFSQPSQFYLGMHTASVLSGLRDGTIYFRVRQKTADSFGPWSQPQAFQVAHPTNTSAFSLFGLGAVIFCATAWVVTQGHLRFGATPLAPLRKLKE